MPRPVKQRTEETYRRDVEALTRLRTALRLDKSIERTVCLQAVQQIDALTDTILSILNRPEAGKAEA